MFPVMEIILGLAAKAWITDSRLTDQIWPLAEDAIDHGLSIPIS
jgi:hypothetical protein